MKLGSLAVTAITVVCAALPASAQTTTAKAGTELTVRGEPNPFGSILGVLETNQEVTIEGCLADVSWCRISSGEMMGWASAQYLYVEEDANAVAIIDMAGDAAAITVIEQGTEGTTKTDQNVAAATLGTVGALTALVLGGPAGAIVAGGILGTAAGAAVAEPSDETILFVTSNPVETVYLDGEVVVGAIVPSEVTTYEVPQGDLRYLTVNGLPILVDAETGTIVRIVR